MNWIHALTEHFANEQGVTEGIDKHSEADRGGSRTMWITLRTEEKDVAVCPPSLLAYACKAINAAIHTRFYSKPAAKTSI